MIKINKFPKPAVLVANEGAWTDEYIRFKNGDAAVPKAAQFRYRHPDLKEALREEASDKCIFCESKISHVFPGETDHIIPVSKKIEYVVKWDNLGYVCKECNRFKSNYHDDNLPLLNPFVDDPKDYLIFFGPLVLAKTGKNRGQITAELLQLSRAALVERKKERIEKVKALLDRAQTLPEGEAREFLISQAKKEADPEREFSATIGAYLQATDA